MADEAEQAARVKRITNELEATYEAMRKSSSHISGLLQGGFATCEEVRAYNAWSIAIFEAQKGMLASLRASGQSNLPAQPAPPTLFPIKGRTGLDAVLIDCGGSQNLAGLMTAAMKPPTKKTVYLSTNQIAIHTQDPWVFRPGEAPSFAQLIANQAKRAQGTQGLGFAPIVIFIAAIVVTIAVVGALTALFKYLETNAIEESNTEQVRLQAQAFAKYTEARLACLQQCTAGGQSQESCVETCSKIVDKPEFDLPGQSKPWGALQWVGAIAVGTIAVYAGWRWYERKYGKPLFELPEPP